MKLPKRSAATTKARHPEVLVVEGDPRLGENLVRYIVRQLGWSCRLAVSLSEAKSILMKDEGVNLIVASLVMRDGNCLDFLNCANLRDCKVLLMSGAVHVAPEAVLREKGADGFIAKPFTLSEFGERLVEVWPVKRRRRQNLELTVSRSDAPRTSLGLFLKLAPVEQAIVEELERNVNQTVSHEALHSHIPNVQYSYDKSNLRVHISRIRDKIRKANFPEHEVVELKNVRSKGYQLSVRTLRK
jgi:DNA-binding response OmpR family regulator